MKANWKTFTDKYPPEGVPLIVTTRHGEVVCPMFLLKRPPFNSEGLFEWDDCVLRPTSRTAIAWDFAPEPYEDKDDDN